MKGLKNSWVGAIASGVVCCSEMVYVKRGKKEKYKICCTRPTVQGGGGGLMVWACMTAKGPGTNNTC